MATFKFREQNRTFFAKAEPDKFVTALNICDMLLAETDVNSVQLKRLGKSNWFPSQFDIKKFI